MFQRKGLAILFAYPAFVNNLFNNSCNFVLTIHYFLLLIGFSFLVLVAVGLSSSLSSSSIMEYFHGSLIGSSFGISNMFLWSYLIPLSSPYFLYLQYSHSSCNANSQYAKYLHGLLRHDSAKYLRGEIGRA